MSLGVMSADYMDAQAFAPDEICIHEHFWRPGKLQSLPTQDLATELALQGVARADSLARNALVRPKRPLP